MAKEKFKDRPIGKILLSKPVKGVLTMLPFGVGQIASNILNEKNGKGKNEVASEAGSIDTSDVNGIIASVGTIIIVILYLTGIIDFGQAKEATELIGN